VYNEKYFLLFKVLVQQASLVSFDVLKLQFLRKKKTICSNKITKKNIVMMSVHKKTLDSWDPPMKRIVTKGHP